MMFRKAVLSGLTAIGLTLGPGLSVAAMAADIVIDESGESGGAGGPGANGGNGANGSGASVIEGTLTGESGGDGDDGDTGGRGDNGDAGGSVDLRIDSPGTNEIVISANGGKGGDGGAGGKGGRGGLGADVNSSEQGRATRGGTGGDGGDGGIGGQGGDGGAGGAIELSVASAVAGDIALSAAGGNGGKGGAGGAGGAGNHGGFPFSWCAPRHGGDGGNGGDGHVGGAAGFGSGTGEVCAEGVTTGVWGNNGTPGQSLPAQYKGADGTDGAGGSITVALTAAVGGGLTANAGAGDISVTLNTGASVGGTISANEAANSALRFAMKVESRADYKAAKAYLGDQANALSGSITINGQSYSWTGFDQLVQALVFAGVRSSGDSDRGLPTYLSCSPRAVTAFYKGGVIELIAGRTDERGAFRIGQLTGQSFASQNSAGWTVRFDAGATRLRFDVLDHSGSIAATCIS